MCQFNQWYLNYYIKLTSVDMEAFKAANPFCVLEDFVRWHSPKDWIVDASGKGTLSERMIDSRNLWHQLWKVFLWSLLTELASEKNSSLPSDSLV
jgi:hypothetical protein